VPDADPLITQRKPTTSTDPAIRRHDLASVRSARIPAGFEPFDCVRYGHCKRSPDVFS
jgi:hypothetical protein